MEVNKAIDLLKKDLDTVKKDLEERGFPSGWVTKVPDIDDNASFLPKGKMKSSNAKTYMSDCSHYEGLYLCGGMSAVKCSLVDDVIPGIVKDLYCMKGYEQCPLKCRKG